MQQSTSETFDDLRRRLGGRRLSAGTQATERARLLCYLSRHGRNVHTALDIVEAATSLAEEEEIAAYHCLEGVAVSHASEGWWLLFSFDDSLLPAASEIGRAHV